MTKAGSRRVLDTFGQFGVTKGNLPLTMAALSQAPVIAMFSHVGFQDAEGRLVLADGLSYAVEQDPDVIIDVATLTGAAVVALGSEVGVFFANNEELAEGLDASGNASGEPWWRLPLYEPYNAHIKSEIADIKNIGASGEAGTISAALFLQRFVGDVPWAHLDIAGPSRSDKERGLYPVGGTAFGLRTILEYLRSL